MVLQPNPFVSASECIRAEVDTGILELDLIYVGKLLAETDLGKQAHNMFMGFQVNSIPAPWGICVCACKRVGYLEVL